MLLSRITRGTGALRLAFMVSILGLTLVLTGCSESGPDALIGAQDDSLVKSTASAEVCETIDFNAFAHGEAISSVSVFGLTISGSAVRYSSTAPDPFPTAYDTNLDGTTAPDPDMVYTNGECAGCEGLGRIAIIPSVNFDQNGDHRFGGVLTFSGFSGEGFYVKSFTAVDAEPTEPGVILNIDGVQVAQALPLANGSVQTVTPATTPIIQSSFSYTFGTEAEDLVSGSGGIDDIKICRTDALGEEGCTLGYWGRHTGEGRGNQRNAWAATGYATSDLLGSVFSGAATYGLGDDTLLDALSYRGGGSVEAAAGLLLKQAVAALLNASHPDVAYSLTESDIVSQVNAALASGDRSTMLDLKDELDAFNNQGCPLN